MQRRPFWFLLNIYGWVVLAMSVVTAIIIGQAWIVLLGVVGYQAALLVDLIGGHSLGRTGAIRLAQAEQENRELKAEQSRLLGAIRDLDTQMAILRADQLTGDAKLLKKDDELPTSDNRPRTTGH